MYIYVRITHAYACAYTYTYTDTYTDTHTDTYTCIHTDALPGAAWRSVLLMCCT
jgi:hypothetical protein